MRPVFVNKEYEQEFLRQGFAVIRNAIPEKEVEQLADFFDGLKIQTGDSFVLANLLEDISLRKKIHSHLQEVLVPWSGSIFKGMKHVLGTLAVKPAGKNTSFGVHQDWSLVDERNFLSVSIWIPLVDVNEKNGCFRVLKGSCESFYYPRGMNIPFPYENYSKEVSDEFMTPVSMQKGDVLVFDHRLVHDSGPNLSDNTRVAVAMAFIPEESPLNHYYREKDSDRIDFYQLPAEFLITNNFFDYSHAPNDSTLIETFPYEKPDINFEKFKQLYAASIS